MTQNPFHDGGALDGDSPVYLEREADREALRRLRRMDYLVLVAPRQQGKSSLINRLAYHLRPDGYEFVVVDAGTLDRSSESAWYGSLRDMTALYLDFADGLPAPTNANTWFRFLKEMADAANRGGRNVVFALDEVGATPAGWATEFFTTIRSIYNYRATLPAFKRLTFIIAGAYNPKDLIRDPTISNFNLAHFSPIDDFSADQVGQLAGRLPSPAGGDAEGIARRLYEWTGGHPYLTQALGYRLYGSDGVTLPHVDDVVEAFFRDDISHFMGIKRWLDGRAGLIDYLRRIITVPTRFAPGINDHQFYLAYVAGIIAAGEGGHCRIRNRMYEHVLASLLEDMVAPASAPPWSNEERLRLFEHMRRHYNQAAFEVLCHELTIDINNLPGATLLNKQHQLVDYLERREQFDVLRRLLTSLPRV